MCGSTSMPRRTRRRRSRPSKLRLSPDLVHGLRDPLDAVFVAGERLELVLERLGRDGAVVADRFEGAQEPGDVDDAGFAGEGADVVDLLIDVDAAGGVVDVDVDDVGG